MSLHWRFRKENTDGGRDFGNANVWAFDPTLDVFTREVCQNTLDVRTGHGPVHLQFDLFRLTGPRLASFLEAMRWESQLRPHLHASADPDQKFGRELQRGLTDLEQDEELTLLRVQELNAKGLSGAEKGDGSNFAALCRNNLDSNKADNAGGAFGLGKAVLWRCSSLSTVLFHSDLAEPLDGDSARRTGRLFGRCELAWHQVGGSGYAGPGWFGALDDQDQAVSAWDAGTDARDLLLGRPAASTGTSIMVVGFNDPSKEGGGDVATMAHELATAVATHFWPALQADVLKADVGYYPDGPDAPRHAVPVDLSGTVGPFVTGAERRASGGFDDALETTGAICRRAIELEVPGRIDGSSGPLSHSADLVVRRADARLEKERVNSVALVRGSRMVVEYWSLPGLRIGARPFHATLFCGEAVGDTLEDVGAELFLRAAEPPSHDRWKLTPDIKATYRSGGGVRLQAMRDSVRATLKELIAPVASDEEDGPEELKRLLTINVGKPRLGEPRIADANGQALDDGWSINVTVTAKQVAGHDWTFLPVVKPAGEDGNGPSIPIASIGELHHCSTEEGTVRLDAAHRQCRFRLTVAGEALPGRPEDLALVVELAKRTSVATS